MLTPWAGERVLADGAQHPQSQELCSQPMAARVLQRVPKSKALPPSCTLFPHRLWVKSLQGQCHAGSAAQHVLLVWSTHDCQA